MRTFGLLFVITRDGYLKFSCDNGNTWKTIGYVDGEIGPSGVAPTITVDSIEAIASDEEAKTVNLGDEKNVILKYYIPDGDKGADAPMPTINEETWHWEIGGEDTGVSAIGSYMNLVIEESEDRNMYGTPSFTARIDGNTCYVQFHCLRGEKADAPKIEVIVDEETQISNLYVDDALLISGSAQANDGKLTVLINDASFQLFTANQSDNKDTYLLLRAGNNISLTKNDTSVEITNTVSNCFTVVKKEFMSDWVGAYLTVPEKYTIKNDVGTEYSLLSIDQFYSTGIMPENVFTWTVAERAEVQRYAGFCYADNGAGMVMGIIEIQPQGADGTFLDNTVEFPLVIAIESITTVSKKLCSVLTQLRWNFITTYEENKVMCFLEVPFSFMGRIVFHPKYYLVSSTNRQVGSFGEIASISWWDTSADFVYLFETLPGLQPTEDVFRLPTGKYSLDVFMETGKKNHELGDTFNTVKIYDYFKNIINNNLIIRKEY